MGAPRQKWISGEEPPLKAGVLKHMPGKWCTILNDPEFWPILHTRSLILKVLLRSLIGLLLLVGLASLYVKRYSSSQENNLEIYFVDTRDPFNDEASSLLHYYNLIQQAADSNSAPKSIIYYDRTIFSGFVVKLTKKEAERMAGFDEVDFVYGDEIFQLDTI